MSSPKSDLNPDEWLHPLAYLFKPGLKSYKTLRLIRLFLAQNGKCFYCNEDMDVYWADDNPRSMTRDHIVPFSETRFSIRALHNPNYVAACRECNERRGTMPIQEFTKMLAMTSAPSETYDRLTKQEADELIADIEDQVVKGLLRRSEGNRKILEILKRIAK